jgi:hypothetical protein
MKSADEGLVMQRKESSLRFSGTPEDKLKQYQDTLSRLRLQTDDLNSKLLHPVAKEAIRHCLTLIELCWSARRDDESDEEITDRLDRMADAVRNRAANIRAIRLSDLCAKLTKLANETTSPENVAAYEAYWESRR